MRLARPTIIDIIGSSFIIGLAARIASSCLPVSSLMRENSINHWYIEIRWSTRALAMEHRSNSGRRLRRHIFRVARSRCQLYLRSFLFYISNLFSEWFALSPLRCCLCDFHTYFRWLHRDYVYALWLVGSSQFIFCSFFFVFISINAYRTANTRIQWLWFKR